MEKKSRETVQKESLEAFKASPFHRGTICLSTGTGKSKVAIDFIKENTEVKSILITSPRTNLKDNWKKELAKWSLIEGNNPNMWYYHDDNIIRELYIEIENIQTVYKWKNRKFDFVIADEIHTMMTPEYSSFFQDNRYEYLMGLTATHDISDKNDKEIYYIRYAPIIYEYYDSAEDELINKTRFVIVNHEMNNVNQMIVRTKTTSFQRGELDQYEYLTANLKKGQAKMMAEGSNDWFTDASEWFWKGNGTREQKQAAMMYLNAIKYRKDYLLNLPSNARIAKKIKEGILRSDPKAKILIFSELTAQVDRITTNTIHSHKKKIDNAELLKDFDEGKIRDLGSCQSLTLGLNLKGATHAIMESYVGSVTQSKQKKGRLDRLAVDDVAEMWIIRVNGTQSEKWFEQMSKDFDFSNAEYVNSSDILNNNYDYGRKR